MLASRVKVPASTRVSFGVYTTLDEVDAFLNALDRVPAVFGLDAEIAQAPDAKAEAS